ncbi:MAG: hypothetical protein ABJN40_05600 [Sneathiella sp.]
MKYIPPLTKTGDASYVPYHIPSGEEGSIPRARVFEHPQREILNVITENGYVPDSANLEQLYTAIQKMINDAVPTLTADALIIEGVTFASSVTTNGQVVYFDDGNSHYDLALGGTHIPSGIADVSNNRVYISGRLPDGFITDLSAGTYYLSTSTAGAITSVVPSGTAIEIGDALSDTVLNVDVGETFNRLATTSVAGLVKKSDLATKAGLDKNRYLTEAQFQKLMDDAIAAHILNLDVTNSHSEVIYDGP